MVPVDSRRVPRVPRYLGATGRRIAFSPTGLSPSMAVLSSTFNYPISYPSLYQSFQRSAISGRPKPMAESRLLRALNSGPATPSSPFGSLGLGYSDFARHYFRNHGCFLFLQVLRW